jgi:hypothetical protein
LRVFQALIVPVVILHLAIEYGAFERAAAALDLKAGSNKNPSAAHVEEIIRKPENEWT